jgi:hypothetical protein
VTSHVLLLFVFVFLIGMPLLLVALTFVVALSEKHLVWPFAPVTSATLAVRPGGAGRTNPYAPPGTDQPISSAEYVEVTNRKAANAGFRPLGTFDDCRGKLYRLRYHLWLSSDRLVLANVGSGLLAGISLSGTWLLTRLSDGRCLYTVDEAKRGDSDPSGLTLQEVVTNADFEELLDRHRQRMAIAEQAPQPYSDSDPLGDYRSYRLFQTQRLVERGFARFLDADCSAWKHTFRGAVFVAIRSNFRQYRQRFRNRGREAIRRPGEAGYVPSSLRSSRRSGLLRTVDMVCWILLAVSLVLNFSQGPARNAVQSLFRAGIAGVALLGLAISWSLKRSQASSRAQRAIPSSSRGGEAETWDEDV